MNYDGGSMEVALGHKFHRVMTTSVFYNKNDDKIPNIYLVL
jgi:hypothetical protein